MREYEPRAYVRYMQSAYVCTYASPRLREKCYTALMTPFAPWTNDSERMKASVRTMRLPFRRAEIAGECGEIETTPLRRRVLISYEDAAFPQNDAIILESYKADSRGGFTARYINYSRISYGIVMLLCYRFW